MAYEIIFSQGRIADRTAGAIKGALLTANMIAKRTGQDALVIGTPDPAIEDDWSTSLPAAHATLLKLKEATSAALARGNTPLIVANTCSASLATLPVVAQNQPDAFVLWIDAHGDFNTPQTTESGYLGGMVLAAACGLWDSGHGNGVDPRKVIIAGIRDVDPTEQELLQQHGVGTLTPAQTTAETILAAIGDAPVWIHIDWDVLEPNYVPAAYAIEKGLLPETIKAILQAIPAKQIIGIKLAEFEASENQTQDEAALAIIGDVISPIFP